MKPLALFCYPLVLIALCGAGCQTEPKARVVRIMLKRSSTDWRVSVNGTNNVSVISKNSLTNVLTRLRLRQGDAILLGTRPSREPSPMLETWDWLARYCASNHVAIYLYGVDNSPAAAHLFSIPVYHWVAPFEFPLNLSMATFFFEGEFLGRGQQGFDRMLNQISRTRLKKVFIIGSLYDINQSLPPNPTPYERQRDQLHSVLKQAGSKIIELDQLPGF